MKFDWVKFLQFQTIVQPLWETIYMVFISTIIALIIGLPIGILLTISDTKGVKPNKTLHKILDIVIVNVTRSIPFIILIVLLIPLSKLLFKYSFGSTSFIVPLSLGSAPFVARVIEGALKEVDEGLIEASKSMGAKTSEIIFKVMIPEAMPALVHGMTLTLISLIGYSAMAGTIGGGGLGNAAVMDGFQRNNMELMWQATIVTIILVQIIQFVGDKIVKALLNKRKRT
ncbi:methionine ABC transporter permease [Leptotrichia buccalis]|jgi:ABC transporter, permease protein|uniref:Binding-protein-dependent transport systems inner membrane component n=1 Tax=Leptotrichia buccalis (strain ATCC 14201 / DSM 1135 / JCM 12969 / NCTC 10249 / C-1013-b) TaxID=523794 RepID=C7NA78_LEPBD|nr:methionine ABC transporter permease [Leptotrichia buccalis]ACV39059.1 binding-protein-dependent transport systems inner membrane component [Leptotrichia buccalis C-1013-b]